MRRPEHVGRGKRMAVEVAAGSVSCRPLLERLTELYRYGFSEILPIDVGADGLVGDDDRDGCWTDPWRHLSSRP
ncbi:MAG: hypothetical protein ACP5QO_06740 [Clostridia bacterium]